jgi:L-asparaginase
MTEVDRQLIASRVISDPHKHIIITHGTDTMIETAKQLEGICDKVIVLTGAMEPAMFKTSDAVFNRVVAK